MFNGFRSNPLYDDNESYFPGNPRNEPTSSVFGLASTQSDVSSANSTMTNSNENNGSSLQRETPLLSTENTIQKIADKDDGSIQGPNSKSNKLLPSENNIGINRM